MFKPNEIPQAVNFIESKSLYKLAMHSSIYAQVRKYEAIAANKGTKGVM